MGKREDNTQEQYLGMSGYTVMHLMETFLHKGRIVYLDNWYSSSKFYLELHRGKTA
jgi:hypothetical protein